MVVDAGLRGCRKVSAREVTLAAPVVSVAPADGTMSFPGADGYLCTLKAANDTVLEHLRTLPGAVAKITYLDGLAINAMR